MCVCVCVLCVLVACTLGVVCACCFVCVVVFVEHLWLCGVSEWQCASVWRAPGALCSREGAGARGVPGKAECVEGSVCLGWGRGYAGFPGVSPGWAAGEGGAFLLSAGWSGNRSPFPHEILIPPSGGPGQIRPDPQGAGRAGWGWGGAAAVRGAAASPSAGVLALRLGRDWEGVRFPHPPTPSAGPLPLRMS